MLPGPRLLHLVVALLLLGVVASFLPALTDAWRWSCVAAGLLAVVDAWRLRRTPMVTLRRRLPARLALGVEQEVEVTVVNGGRRPVSVRVLDGLPPMLRSGDWPWRGELPAGGHATVAARVRAVSRGAAPIGPAWVEMASPAGLWVRRGRAGTDETVKVYPNYEPVLRFALLAMQHREAQMGIQRRNRAGQSREFRQLRDHQEGDPLNALDWKATSRRLVLTSREYEEQRNQTLIMMADCGRRLRSLDGELTQFDHTLNAMLLLGYIALRQGDRVGVMAFGGDDRWLPPQSGTGAMPQLLEHLHDYQSTSAPGDFAEAAELIMQRQRRRALVVFCTNLRSEDLHHVIRPLQLLRRRHLVVVASLREAEVIQQWQARVADFPGALTHAATGQYLEERRLVAAALRREGVMTIDAAAAALPVSLGNLYLDIKREGRL